MVITHHRSDPPGRGHSGCVYKNAHLEDGEALRLPCLWSRAWLPTCPRAALVARCRLRLHEVTQSSTRVTAARRDGPPAVSR